MVAGAHHLCHYYSMSRLSRDVHRRKLVRHLSQSIDEAMISLVSSVVAVQSGNWDALFTVPDMPPEAVGTELGSPWHIPPWSLETLVNELLATPKLKGFGVGRTRILDAQHFRTLQVLYRILVEIENAEDGIFLEKHDVLYEMARIAQRQFPWQRGVANAPHLYRSMLLYGTGAAREFFEADTGIALPDFIKAGAYFSRALQRTDSISREQDLSSIGITPAMKEAVLSKIAVTHAQSRILAYRMRSSRRHTGYSPSVLRDYPIIAFGKHGERLRSPLPELIMYRYTSGLYLDVVRGGPAVWTEIGERFEAYVLEYLQAMMAPYEVAGEALYGPKKAKHRSPDVLVSRNASIVAAIECKAKRMSFSARFADDPVAEAALGFNELAKGIFQIWRFFSHARRGLTGDICVAPDCQGVIVTADSWLAMASNQAQCVLATAQKLADAEGGIEVQDRREIAFCQIEEVELTLQQGSADTFLAACREITIGDKKGFMLSDAHGVNPEFRRDYPFKERIFDILPWMARGDA